jgi:hypothetical protein
MESDPTITAALRAADEAMRAATMANFRALMTVESADRPARNNCAAAAIAAFLRALPDVRLPDDTAHDGFRLVMAPESDALAAAVEAACDAA